MSLRDPILSMRGENMSLFKQYQQDLIEQINSISEATVLEVKNLLLKARQNRKTVFIIGNGGSAATASHFACDLGKGCSRQDQVNFKVMSLTDNTPWMTAISNDISYDGVFINQLSNFAEKGDILIAISASGNSENIIQACQYAKEKGLLVIAFVGFAGGKIKELADISLWIKSKDYGVVEDCHLMLEHMVSHLIRNEPDC